MKANTLKYITLFLWYLRLDFLIAKLFGILTIRANQKEITSNATRCSFILAMERAAFNEDVRSLREYILLNKLPWRIIDFKIQRYTNLFLPHEIRGQFTFYPKRHKYKKIFCRISKIFSGTLDFLAAHAAAEVKILLTANIDYARDYPWIATMKNREGKFVALNKESVIYTLNEKRIRVAEYKKNNFVYEGDAVLFYNRLSMDAFISSGAVISSKGHVTGCPRIDKAFSIAKTKKKRSDFVLLGSFASRFSWAPKLWDEVLEAIASDPILGPKTIVKCKAEDEVSPIRKRFPYVTISCDPLEKYLEMSPAIFVGFNSTSCFDAILAGVPLVVPLWSDGAKLGDDALLGKHTGDFHFIAENPESLKKILYSFLNITNNNFPQKTSWRDDSRLREFIELRYSKLDGKNCERFFGFLNRYL